MKPDFRLYGLAAPRLASTSSGGTWKLLMPLAWAFLATPFRCAPDARSLTIWDASASVMPKCGLVWTKWSRNAGPAAVQRSMSSIAIHPSHVPF